MEPVIFHIDVNSAFLSWTAIEQLKNGSTVDLRTIPAIIGGDRESRHGIVLAKSTSAKTFGIKTGEPVAHALRKCESLVIARPDSCDVPSVFQAAYDASAYVYTGH